jgi:hypothetical protein
MSQYLQRLAVVKAQYIWLRTKTNLHRLYANFLAVGGGGKQQAQNSRRVIA